MISDEDAKLLGEGIRGLLGVLIKVATIYVLFGIGHWLFSL